MHTYMFMFGHVCMFNVFDMFSMLLCGHVWACLGMSGHVWVCLGMFGHVWACLACSGLHSSTLHVIAPFVQMFLDITKAELAFVFCCVTLLRGALVYFLEQF